MKLLLVNDDGVHATGIQNLYQNLKHDHDVTVLAPLTERSATGHTLTLDHPLRLVEVNENVFGLSGFPADCTLLGLTHLQKKLNKKFDMVISGINRGANLGQDIFYSGTVAGAREASFRGVPAISVSSCMDFHSQDKNENYYDTASNLIKKILQFNVHEFIPKHGIININVPWCAESEIRGIKLTRLGFRHYGEEILERTDFRGREYFWIGGSYNGYHRDNDSDCQAIEDKNVSVSVLKLNDFLSDMTHEKSQNLNSVLQRLF